MEQLAGVKLAFTSLELDEECVGWGRGWWGLSAMTDEEDQLKRRAGRRGAEEL